jgi:predicted small lipoprotein YifL
MQCKLVMTSLCVLFLIAGLGSCGKRGDPYRPSEIPAQQTNS